MSVFIPVMFQHIPLGMHDRNKPPDTVTPTSAVAVPVVTAVGSSLATEVAQATIILAVSITTMAN
jgi:hypothetical protein